MRQTAEIISMVLCLDKTPHHALPSLTGSIDESVKRFGVCLYYFNILTDAQARLHALRANTHLLLGCPPQ